MATHSRILAWEIPWTEESGRLQSIGSQVMKEGLNSNNKLSDGFLTFFNSLIV